MENPLRFEEDHELIGEVEEDNVYCIVSIVQNSYLTTVDILVLPVSRQACQGLR